MKNLVMCFDSTNARPGPRDATNAETLLRLLDTSDDGQLVWYDAGEAALGSPSSSTRLPATGAGPSPRRPGNPSSTRTYSSPSTGSPTTGSS